MRVSGENRANDHEEDAMKIRIRSRHDSLSGTLAEHIVRRVEFALSRFQDRIASVGVELWDENGPRGGVDKACRVEIRPRGGDVIFAEAIDVDPYRSASRATRRSTRALVRALDKMQATRRSRRGEARVSDGGLGELAG